MGHTAKSRRPSNLGGEVEGEEDGEEGTGEAEEEEDGGVEDQPHVFLSKMHFVAGAILSTAQFIVNVYW